MPGPLQAAGAVSEPSEYAPLTMDRYITGLWTQRSPLRDADVPYLYTKFYSASRYDSLIDGINREITSRLTVQRRCGLSPYNTNNFPPINSFFSLKYQLNNVQQVRVIADTAAKIYDATAGQQTVIYNKAAGAGKARFQSVGGEMFFGDGVDTKKYLRPSTTWSANTAFADGTYIIDPNGNLQLVSAESIGLAITSVEVNYSQPVVGGAKFYYLLLTFSAPVPAISPGTNLSFGGLEHYTQLNEQTISYTPFPLYVGATEYQLAIPWTAPAYANTADTGTMTGIVDGSGTTGGAQPAWATEVGAYTNDGTVHWRCFGVPVYNWGLAAPTVAPTVTIGTGERQWSANAQLYYLYSILDTNGNIQVAINTTSAGNYATGSTQPNWKQNVGNTTSDGTIIWVNMGIPGSWSPDTLEPTYTLILDSNSNLQYSSTQTGTTGGTVPAWNTALGGTTTDGGVTWVCLGPGNTLTTAQQQYAYSFHSIDGSVSTASPLATLAGGNLGPGSQFSNLLTAPNTTDVQCDQIWIWRTAQGGATLLLLAQIPNPSVGSLAQWNYTDTIPDVSTSGGPQLNAEIAAPIADANDPPPAGSTAPAYHLQRTWVIVGDTVYYSGGPDTLVGNGNTAFPPLNSFVYPETIVKLIPFTVDNGGLLVIGTANVYVILGTGTASNPFYTTLYMANLGFLSYDAMDMVGSTLYGLANNGKFVSLDPSAGYVEPGFPIGDQFQKVTTGGISQALYNPATSYVAWNERSSGDSGIYVSDGSVGWFRYSPVASPESGFLWSPRAAIAGGTSAVQNVETQTGVQTLLVGPSGNGPILMRDNTVFADNGTAYSSYITIGNVVLCESGEVAEVAHVALKSIRIGAAPSVGMLFGEIAATTSVPMEMYTVTCPDPPDLPESATLFSDRYVMMDNSGVCPKCDNFQLMISWPVQSVGDELLTHSVYGAKWAERKQQ